MATKSKSEIIESTTAIIEEQALTKEQLLGYLRQIMEIRAFENNISSLLGRDLLKGASHLYAGSEAVAVGAISAMREDDLVTSTHRGHGHAHAHGDTHAKTPEEKQTHFNKMMAEVLGKSGGYCKGKGGSMHIADVDHGNLGATGIVAGNLPVAVGAALAQKLQGSDKVVLCFLGDGASNSGNFHESLNMASIWDLPVVFVVENNLYGMSVPFAKVSKLPNVADRACAYGIPGEVVDGMDALAVRGAVQKAIAHARQGKGPSIVEAKTYRYFGHSHSDPRAYRTKEEEQAYKDRDPILILSQELKAVGMLSDEEMEAIDSEVKSKLKKAMAYSESSPTPDPSELETDVYAPSIFTVKDIETEAELREKIRTDPNIRQISYAEAIQEALREEMLRDERVFIMGEDVGLYGGAYGATRNLFNEFGGWRVLDTPISEAAIGGAAVGAAMAGMRPVAEIMYVDFSPLCMDQIANQGAKNRYMFGGKTSVPMVVRTEGGAGRAIAAHHSQSLESLWTHFPGIYVVMPATPYDVKGLLKAAIRDNNPVIFIEHKMLYKTKGPVPEGEYLIPLGSADVKRSGKDITIATYSRQVLNALSAAEILAKEGIDVEVVDLRSLKPLDTHTLIDSVKKTGRFVGVTEAYENTSFINEVMAVVNEQAFDWLDAPMQRVAAANVPVPRSEVLEDLAIPNVQRIVDACRKVMR
ncbi:alpha-ketoacid dehydrogenase subunit alpha/beta [Pelolinea submarina]|uniref:2-oxoisovalerate dehydrogenase E1 component n=1 Tax=Pelolinea submarina TaxID=913107 RepID=A0A347ZQW5_9CHLR|nr:pyruvate dehydrogenase complex E1 component subunit beta [Pelolinea submarina]REG11749.1 2-oxoisovalerate dehydrogenase E1 component [Pelolinea submarina]BBB47696.1 2-oxoisovalerate dehydrogenase E1 component [Pelolinea submarina]